MKSPDSCEVSGALRRSAHHVTYEAEASRDSARYHCDEVATVPSVLLQVPATALIALRDVRGKVETHTLP